MSRYNVYVTIFGPQTATGKGTSLESFEYSRLVAQLNSLKFKRRGTKVVTYELSESDYKLYQSTVKQLQLFHNGTIKKPPYTDIQPKHEELDRVLGPQTSANEKTTLCRHQPNTHPKTDRKLKAQLMHRYIVDVILAMGRGCEAEEMEE